MRRQVLRLVMLSAELLEQFRVRSNAVAERVELAFPELICNELAPKLQRSPSFCGGFDSALVLLVFSLASLISRPTNRVTTLAATTLIFLPRMQGSTALTADHVARMVQRRAKLSGLAGDWAAHSLRSGFVTEVGRQGVPLGEVMATTEYRGVCTVMGYFQAGNLLGSRASSLWALASPLGGVPDRPKDGT